MSASIGAMEEMSGKVQNASTHRLGRINHEHVHSSRSVQGSQFKGAKDESSGNVQKASTHVGCGVVMDIAAFEVSHSVGSGIDAAALRAARARSSSIGAMDASSGKVQDASTRNQRCCHGYCSLQS